MQSVVLEKFLDEADKRIRRHKLHQRVGEPKPVDSLLEAYRVACEDLEYGIQAITVRWRRYRQQFIHITYHAGLDDPSVSALRRKVLAHELGHVICQHRGDMWILWSEDTPAGAFHHELNRVQERECNSLASYLLISLADLESLRCMEPWYIARRLDVPEDLVALRWEIWHKFSR